MQPGEALDVAAQVAVTLAGFAGIVVVFRPQSLHQWAAIDRLRLRLLLANSALPLVLSLFGILLLTLDPPPSNIWRWCSSLALVLQVPFAISASRAQRQIPRAEFRKTTALLYYPIAAIGLTSFVLQGLNIFAWNVFWAFFAGLFVNLSAGIGQFVRFILLPHDPANANHQQRTDHDRGNR